MHKLLFREKTKSKCKRHQFIVPKDLEDTVCEFYHCTCDDLRMKSPGKSNMDDNEPGSRKGNINQARQVMMFLLQYEYDWSMKSAGAQYSRDHTTALHARNKIMTMLECDNTFRDKFYAILLTLGVESITIWDNYVLFKKSVGCYEMQNSF